MIKVLKENEKEKKYVTPITDYNDFKWSTSHVNADD